MSGFKSFGGRNTIIFMESASYQKICALTARAQKKKQTESNDDHRLNYEKSAVGQKKRDEDPESKGEDRDTDQFSECHAFHKLPPFAFYIYYMRGEVKK